MYIRESADEAGRQAGRQGGARRVHVRVKQGEIRGKNGFGEQSEE